MKIQTITIITQPGVKQYFVGQSGENGTIKRFEDCSLEYEDHIHSLYYGYNEDDKMILKIENCPVVIDYATNN